MKRTPQKSIHSGPKRAAKRKPTGRPRISSANTGAVVAVVNGVLVGVGGLYAITLSVPLTIVAAALAVLLGTIAILRQ